MFLFYLANYFVIVFFNVALVSAASSRLAGGHATINDGLEAAWQRKGRILQWAFLSATVGTFADDRERAAWLGRIVRRIVIGLVGMAWTLASYFVVPVLVAEDLVRPRRCNVRLICSAKPGVRKWQVALVSD